MTGCFSDLCLVIHKSNFSNYKIAKNTSSMKQNNWTTICTQNEAERAGETLIWLESVTDKETGNAQPSACVDVLPRCCERLVLFFIDSRSIFLAAKTKTLRSFLAPKLHGNACYAAYQRCGLSHCPFLVKRFCFVSPIIHFETPLELATLATGLLTNLYPELLNKIVRLAKVLPRGNLALSKQLRILVAAADVPLARL